LAWLLAVGAGCATPEPLLAAATVTPGERWPGHAQRAYRVHSTNAGRFVELQSTAGAVEATGLESRVSSGDPRVFFVVHPQATVDARSPQVFTLLNRAGEACVVEVVRAVVLERRLHEAPEQVPNPATPPPAALALEVDPTGCGSAEVALPGAHPRARLEPVPLRRASREVLGGVTPETTLRATLTFAPSPGGGCPGLPATLRFDWDDERHVSLRVEQHVIELFLLHTGTESLVWVGHVGETAVYSLSEGALVETLAEVRDVGLGAGCTAGR
jgi:hypothetical protein